MNSPSSPTCYLSDTSFNHTMPNSNRVDIVSIPAIDDLINSYLTKPAHGLTGVAVMAVNKEGEAIYSNALGKRSLDPAKDEPMTLDTVHWIASQTKIITAVAVMQCVERGQIGLDDPVGRICPELAEPMIIEGLDEHGTPIMRKAEKALTLRNLLSHTSGFAYPHGNTLLEGWLKAMGRSNNHMTFNIEDFKLPLVFEPGSSWVYGVGTDWAGQVVERLNNCTLGEFMENIWKPLGMTDTTFHPETRPDLMSRMVGTCNRMSDGTLVNGVHRVPMPTPSDIGGSGCYSTCQDFIKLLTAILQDGGAILKKESVDEIFKPQLDRNAKEALAALRSVYAGVPDEIEMNFGLTTALNLDPIPGVRAAGTGSWGGMPMLGWWVDRESGVAATIFQQVLPPQDKVSGTFMMEFEDALYRNMRGF
ncbi:hypothetical protein FRB94_012709 [Tulasnella sp. JGI-2019a]|nr:hypothetical protein FRB93_010529 [Tulasnella sp. JGI-2019a]KAG8991152.1 hypothetical protein FRB94_012709 [Tulasnella sp. JGI-2019a]